jgi:hypothetical protein
MLIVWTFAVLAGLYGLHRLALHLESVGLMYYLHKKPESSGGGSALGLLQELVQPQSRHVIEAEDHRHVEVTDDAGAPQHVIGKRVTDSVPHAQTGAAAGGTIWD